MKRDTSYAGLLKLQVIGIYSLAVIILTGQVAYGQQKRQQSPNNFSLFAQDCVTRGDGEFGRTNDKVSIGKQVFDSTHYVRLYTGQSKLLVCRIKQMSNKPTTLQLTFGMQDSERDSTVKVTVSLNGKPTASEEVRPGELKTMLIDVTKIKNVALDISCEKPNGNSCSPIYIIKESLILADRSTLIGTEEDMNISLSPIKNTTNTITDTKETLENTKINVEKIIELFKKIPAILK